MGELIEELSPSSRVGMNVERKIAALLPLQDISLPCIVFPVFYPLRDQYTATKLNVPATKILVLTCALRETKR
jgi:hypothetical protein